jgi:drug/metabolite transporter (DMT)-like permease
MPAGNISEIRGVRSAMLFLILGAFLISFSGVWVKVSHVTPTASAFYRALFGGIILLAAASWRRELKWPGGRTLLAAFICGLFLALDLALYHYSIHYVGPGLGTILPNFQVIILAFVGYFFLKEKIRISFAASIPLAFLGLLMIIGIDWGQLGREYRIGVYCGLIAAACYAGFLLSLRKLQSDQVGVSVFYVLMTVSFATAAFLAVEIHRTADTFRIPDIQSFMALAALGLLSQSVGWILITNALPHIRTSLSGFVLLLQPALAFLWDVLFFHRPTNVMNWIGVGVALSAIYIGTAKPTQSGNKLKSPKTPA